jgi:mono/diheme cytochrome c family protein
MSDGQAHSILSFMRATQSSGDAPVTTARERTAALVLGRNCAMCHMIDGAGASAAPDLSRVGSRHDAAWLREWIASPESVDPLASMPPFGELLSEGEMDALVDYLASRR